MADPSKPRREGWPFTAEHTGTCTGCTDEVRPGDRIVRMDDDTYRHVGDCEKS